MEGWTIYLCGEKSVNPLRDEASLKLYLRTGTYDRPKNTQAIDSACALLDSALAIDAPGAVEPHLSYGMNGDR